MSVRILAVICTVQTVLFVVVFLALRRALWEIRVLEDAIDRTAEGTTPKPRILVAPISRIHPDSNMWEVAKLDVTRHAPGDRIRAGLPLVPGPLLDDQRRRTWIIHGTRPEHRRLRPAAWLCRDVDVPEAG